MAAVVFGGGTPEIAISLSHLAGVTLTTPTVAANIWAGHSQPYLELVGALNLRAGNNSSTALLQPRELDGVCNQLASTVGLPAQEALAQLAYGPAGAGETWASIPGSWVQQFDTWRAV